MRASRCPPTARSRVAPVADGDVHRGQALRRQPALGGRRSTCGPGSASRRETTIAIQFQRAPPPPSRRSRTTNCAQTCSHPRAAGRGRLARDRSQGGAGMRSAPCTWTSSTAAPSDAAGAYEQLILDVARRRNSSREDEVRSNSSSARSRRGCATGQPELRADGGRRRPDDLIPGGHSQASGLRG